MIIKILGFMDLFVSFIVLFQYFANPSTQIVILSFLYLIIKGSLTWKNIAGLIDIIAAVYLIIVFIFGIHSFLNFIIFLLLIQKAVFSLL